MSLLTFLPLNFISSQVRLIFLYHFKYLKRFKIWLNFIVSRHHQENCEKESSYKFNIIIRRNNWFLNSNAIEFLKTCGMPAVFQLPASHVLPYRLVFCFASCRELFWHVICTSWKINSLQNVNDFTCFKFISNRVFPVKKQSTLQVFRLH